MSDKKWTDAQGRPIRVRDEDPTNGMSWPVMCSRCNHIHDGGKVEVVARYSDCSVWNCPKCKSQIDDRPIGWGGSAIHGRDLTERLESYRRMGVVFR